MIKVSTVIKKNKNLSYPEFYEHWLHEHAEIALGTTSWYKYMRKYVQSHTVQELHKDQKPNFDGVGHFWLDSVESFREWTQLPELSVVAADTKILVDNAHNLTRLFTNEVELFSLPNREQKSNLKIISFVKKSQAMPVDEFHDYWENQHSQLMMSRTWWKHCNRYVQNHIQYDAYPNSEAPLGYNGFEEIWFDSLEALNEWNNGRLNDQTIIADQKNFIDHVDSIFINEVHMHS